MKNYRVSSLVIGALILVVLLGVNNHRRVSHSIWTSAEREKYHTNPFLGVSGSRSPLDASD